MQRVPGPAPSKKCLLPGSKSNYCTCNVVRSLFMHLYSYTYTNCVKNLCCVKIKQIMEKLIAEKFYSARIKLYFKNSNFSTRSLAKHEHVSLFIEFETL